MLAYGPIEPGAFAAIEVLALRVLAGGLEYGEPDKTPPKLSFAPATRAAVSLT